MTFNTKSKYGNFVSPFDGAEFASEVKLGVDVDAQNKGIGLALDTYTARWQSI